MSYYHFKDALIFEAQGADLERYLNARLTNDIKELSPLNACEAAALNAQGRTQAFVLAAKLETDKAILVCDSGNSEQVLASLAQFIVADRVEIKPAADSFAYIHVLELDLLNTALEINSLSENQIQICDLGFAIGRDRTGSLGADLIISSKELNNTLEKLNAAKANSLSSEEWHARCIAASRPSFPTELNSSSLFSEAGIKSAISFTKGCYVGQEVMEKIDAFAKTPFILKSMYLDGRPNIAGVQSISNDAGDKIGELISSAYLEQEDKTYIFIRVKNKEDILKANIFADSEKLLFTTGKQS